MELICSKVNQTIEVPKGEGWNAVRFYEDVFKAIQCRGNDDGDLLSVEISIGTVFYCIIEVAHPQPAFRGPAAVKTNNVEKVVKKATDAGATKGLTIQGDSYIEDPFGIQWMILKGEKAGVNGAVLALEEPEGAEVLVLGEGARTGYQGEGAATSRRGPVLLRIHAKGAGAGDGAGTSCEGAQN